MIKGNYYKQFSFFIEELSSGNQFPRLLKIFILILLIPALFVNLGIMPFILDEATRGLVALEMLFSGNYVVPTINGEFYYNKPPLFNWILIGFVKLTGNYSEFIFRLPVVLSLIGFAFTVYFTLRKELGKEVAFITAIALITCGRIFFYDSFKGLIDITFSWLTYTSFWCVYYFNRKGMFFKLFFFTWLLTAIGFLMKGLPSLVFQGITLFIFFLYTRQFRRLFSWQHITSGFIFLLIIAGYFMLYSQYNSLDNYWNALWSESAKRTAIENSFRETAIHLLTFPAEFLLHFLPWTLLLVFLVGKGRVRNLFMIPALRFIIIVFLANILIYWISPAIYPRYLFMFLPLIYGIGTYAYLNFGIGTNADRYFWQPLMIVFAIALSVILLALPLIGSAETSAYMVVIWLSLLLISVFFTFLLIRLKRYRLYFFIITLILSRVAFNFFVLPDRLANGFEHNQREGVKEAARITGDAKVYLYKDCPFHHTSSFYFTAEKKAILSRWHHLPESDAYYFMRTKDIKESDKVEILHTFETGISRQEIALLRFR